MIAAPVSAKKISAPVVKTAPVVQAKLATASVKAAPIAPAKKIETPVAHKIQAAPIVVAAKPV